MARLNEPPPSVESIDALKRRFVRQNREIARANSTQSLRIRNLESEISRLLAENIAFREQCIKLQYELDNGPGRGAMESVGIIKGRLEAKLTELGCLVEELGAVQKSKRNRSPRRKSTIQSPPKRSPDQKNWKNTLTLSEVTGGTDGRLPPIVEDKYFPRRTLDAEDLLDMITEPVNVTDSPDLGPPPVAHFEEGDPIKFGNNQGLSSKKTGGEVTDGNNPPLPANLETRRKRRESSHHLETSRPVTVDTLSITGQPLKSGAKRKLNARDDEDPVEKISEKDDFRFNRRSAGSTTSANSLEADKGHSIIQKVSQDIATVREMSRDKSKAAPLPTTTTARKALGPKSVNTDPLASPAKVKANASKDKTGELKDDLSKKLKSRPRLKDKPLPSDAVPALKAPDNEPPFTQLTTLPPETPAPPPLDLFSPLSSEPSAPRAQGRDTPPPPDLHHDNSSTNAFGTAGRGSRRPRGSVSYAEPNLRDKMRRPTKELVDAVGADERVQVVGSRRVEGVVSSEAQAEQETAKRTIVIKKEPIDMLPNWKFPVMANDAQLQQERERAEPTSPLGNKSSSAPAVASAQSEKLPPTVLTDRRRRTMTVQRAADDDDASAEPGKPPSSGAGTAIAALVAGSGGSKTRKRDAAGEVVVQRGEDEKIADEWGTKGDIYELHTSSPMTEGGAVAKDAVLPTTTTTTTRTSSRRHSSVPSLTVDDVKSSGAALIARRAERREGLVGGDGVRGGVRGSRSVLGLKGEARVREVRGRGDNARGGVTDVGGGGAGSREERAAGRRRSMLL